MAAEPNIEGIVRLMDDAAAAMRSQPDRSGCLVELPAEGEILVTGDLHGNQNNLLQIIKLANLQRFTARHLVIQELVHDICVESEVCKSYRLVEIAARLALTFPRRVHCLLGNHEFAEAMDLLIGKNGRELNLSFEEGLRQAYGESWASVKAAFCRFWMACPVAVRTANRLFISHSTPRLADMEMLTLEHLRAAGPEQIFDRHTPVFDMVWGRDYRPATAEEFCRRVEADALIVGHTPCDEGVRVPNSRHIILDCKDYHAHYALLPLDKPLTQSDIVARIHPLYA